MSEAARWRYLILCEGVWEAILWGDLEGGLWWYLGGRYLRIFGMQLFEDIWQAVLWWYVRGSFMTIFGRQLCVDFWREFYEDTLEAALWGYLGGSFVRTFARQFYEDIEDAVLPGYLGGRFMRIFGMQFLWGHVGGSFVKIFGRQLGEDSWEAVLWGHLEVKLMGMFGRQFCADTREAVVWGYLGGSFVRILRGQFSGLPKTAKSTVLCASCLRSRSICPSKIPQMLRCALNVPGETHWKLEFWKSLGRALKIPDATHRMPEWKNHSSGWFWNIDVESTCAINFHRVTSKPL